LPSRRKISASLQQQVRKRANGFCEYCHASEQWQYVRFTIDHVIPLAHGGTDAFRNLALACFHCNRRKADRVVAVEPESKEDVALFNPRQHVWSEHFIWSADGLLMIGLTPTGQATITALALNRERIVAIREADRTAGRHPPVGDPIQGKQSEREP